MNKQTTVTIDQATSKKLDKLALTNGLSKKDFIDQALAYFEKYGINPTQDETPVKEIDRLRKRQDQIVAFLRKQEKDILEPSLMGIIQAEERMKFEMDKLKVLLETLTTSEQSNDFAVQIVGYIKKVGEEIIKQQKTIASNQERIISRQIEEQRTNQSKTEKALLEIIKYLDKKDKEGLAGKVKNLFS